MSLKYSAASHAVASLAAGQPVHVLVNATGKITQWHQAIILCGVEYVLGAVGLEYKVQVTDTNVPVVCNVSRDSEHIRVAPQ